MIPDNTSNNEAKQLVLGTDVSATPTETAAAAKKTEDFGLLNDCPDEIPFTQSDTWRVLRIQSEFVYSFERMSKIGPAVAIFGSARLGEGDAYYETTRQLAAKLVDGGWTIITGGGPGLFLLLFSPAAVPAVASRFSISDFSFFALLDFR